MKKILLCALLISHSPIFAMKSSKDLEANRPVRSRKTRTLTTQQFDQLFGQLETMNETFVTLNKTIKEKATGNGAVAMLPMAIMCHAIILGLYFGLGR